jgi:hypothetical protein
MRLISAMPGGDPPHASDADRHLVVERQEETTNWRLELADGRDVMLHRLLDRESEAVPRLQPVVAPGQVLEPQARDGVQVPMQVGLSDLDHRPPRRFSG